MLTVAGRPDLMGPRTSLTLYEGMTGMSENALINMKNRWAPSRPNWTFRRAGARV